MIVQWWVLGRFWLVQVKVVRQSFAEYSDCLGKTLLWCLVTVAWMLPDGKRVKSPREGWDGPSTMLVALWMQWLLKDASMTDRKTPMNFYVVLTICCKILRSEMVQFPYQTVRTAGLTAHYCSHVAGGDEERGKLSSTSTGSGDAARLSWLGKWCW